MEEGQLLADRYELGQVLGRGGMAEVRRARDTRLDREVAVKIFRGAAADRQRFDGEMRLLAGLRHPALLGLHDGGEQDGTPFLVLELAAGPTLAERLRRGPLPSDEVAELVGTMAAGLAHLHEQGIVHRDLKPSNVLSTDDGRWLLGDFGIARLVDATGLTATGTTVGTPAYLAPEQVQGGAVGPPADVYALGLLTLEALTGATAFPGPRNEAALARLTTDPPVAGVADPAWRDLLSRMTARDPAARSSAEAVLASVPTGQPETVPLAVPPTELLPVESGAKNGPPAVLVGLVALLVVALAAVLLARALGGDDGGDDVAGAADPTTGPATTLPVTTVAPTTTPVTAPLTTAIPATTVPSTTCEDLEAQLQSIEDQKEVLDQEPADDGPGNGNGNGNGPGGNEERKEQERLLDEQKREVEDALRENDC